MRKLFFVLIALCGILMTGCAQLVSLDENQSDMIAEYMAGTVLKHSNKYKEALIYPVQTENDSKNKEQNVTADSEQQSSGMTINTALKNDENSTFTKEEKVSVEDLFNSISEGGYKVEYKAYKFYDSYPETSEYFAMESAKDKKILEVTLKLKNISEKNLVVNLMKKNINYKLTDSNGNTYSSMLTLLENDIQFLNLSIPEGKSKEAVVLFEVSKDISKKGLRFYTTYNSKTAIIDLNE